jgi:hypothetical protein
VELVGNEERDIQEELKKILEENNKHEEYLTKTFKKKVKRAKVPLSYSYLYAYC